MRLIIETAGDRDHLETNWARIRQALPGLLHVVDGDLVATFKPLPPSGQTPAQTTPPHPAICQPGTATPPPPGQTAQG
jgi:hypothetical protein